MADKAAGPESPGDAASQGSEPDSPDQVTAAGRAQPRDDAEQQDEAAAGDEMQPKFREALERKRAREAGTVSARRGKDAGKIHGAHGPARNRRTFRRKSG